MCDTVRRPTSPRAFSLIGLSPSHPTYPACQRPLTLLPHCGCCCRTQLVNEAFFLLSENVGSAEDIDRSMRLGTNMQLGPLRMADNIGEPGIRHLGGCSR